MCTICVVHMTFTQCEMTILMLLANYACTAYNCREIGVLHKSLPQNHYYCHLIRTASHEWHDWPEWAVSIGVYTIRWLYSWHFILANTTRLGNGFAVCLCPTSWCCNFSMMCPYKNDMHCDVRQVNYAQMSEHGHCQPHEGDVSHKWCMSTILWFMRV